MKKAINNNLLILSASNELHNFVRKSLQNKSSICIVFKQSIHQSISEIYLKYFKAIIIDEDYKKKGNGYNLLIETISHEYLSKESIVLINDSSFRNISNYLKYDITCLINKPVNKDLLKAVLMNKLDILSQYKDQYIKNYGIRLYRLQKFLIVKGCKIYLSKSQTNIIYFLLLNPNPCESRYIIKYLNCCRDKNTTNSYLSANISQLRTKFIKHIGMNVIKSRRGFGYYISI
jgi:DNA-binding response OmpR family regulator